MIYLHLIVWNSYDQRGWNPTFSDTLRDRCENRALCRSPRGSDGVHDVNIVKWPIINLL
jgi:hypothetical protein